MQVPSGNCLEAWGVPGGTGLGISPAMRTTIASLLLLAACQTDATDLTDITDTTGDTTGCQDASACQLVDSTDIAGQFPVVEMESMAFTDDNAQTYTLVRVVYGSGHNCDADNNCDYSSYCSWVTLGTEFPKFFEFVVDSEALFDPSDYCDADGYCDMPGDALPINDDPNVQDWVFFSDCYN
jgi:hypothetical protein